MTSLKVTRRAPRRANAVAPRPPIGASGASHPPPPCPPAMAKPIAAPKRLSAATLCIGAAARAVAVVVER